MRSDFSLNNIFPPNWGMLRRFRHVQIFFKNLNASRPSEDPPLSRVEHVKAFSYEVGHRPQRQNPFTVIGFYFFQGPS